ncbi:hypothetical protein D6D04_07358 [Aureobasidium pullulans]|nr:hypothetical protein D6D04_07358 [Aureobasidium pullulans]
MLWHNCALPGHPQQPRSLAVSFARVNSSTRDLLLHDHCFHLQSSTTRSSTIRFDVSRYYRRGLQCTSPHRLDKSLVAPATGRFAFIAACISFTEFIGVGDLLGSCLPRYAT